jgi:hypothetical protein
MMFTFTRSSHKSIIMIDGPCSHLIKIDNDGLTKISTMSPQPYVDYELDSAYNYVRVVGVDDV